MKQNILALNTNWKCSMEIIKIKIFMEYLYKYLFVMLLRYV